MATTQTPAAHETTERIVVVNEFDKMILNVEAPMDAPAKNAVGSLTVPGDESPNTAHLPL